MTARRIAGSVLAATTVLVVACGGSSGHTTSARSSTSTAAATTTSRPAPPVRGAATTAPRWTTYGGSNSRAGVVAGAPSKPKLKRRFDLPVDGEVYAQPLISGGRIYVATEKNTVYAFKTSGQLAWKRHLGSPVPGGELPCGNIDPSGITGTPVISHGRLFVVAYLHSGHKHVLFGLGLAHGGVAVRSNVDPPNREVEQERGALLALSGRIYVPYGGLNGDCGDFHGYVVSTTETGVSRITYRNPSPEAGIWSPGGVVAQSGTVLVSTGNGGSGGPFQYQNSVIRLSTDLHRRGYWAPKDWAALSAGDIDEGSLAPLPVSRKRVFQIGKDGVGYLLRHALGGVNQHQFRAQVCDGGAFGADAFRAPLAIVPCGDSLFGLRIGDHRFRIAWRNSAGGSVPIIAGNSAYALTRDGSLNQFRFSDGHQIRSVQVGGGATSFPALSAAGHTLAAPAGRKVVVFGI